MDKCKEHLKSDGWNLSEECLQCIGGSNKYDYREVVSNALNIDLKEIGEACLAAHVSKQRICQLVLQIQKIRNVSAPRANEDSQTAPRMLKLTLTDGHSTCQAIEVENLPDLNIHKTAPGTKLLINGARVQGGYVLLDKSCCRNLGGRVQALYEKWELAKQMLKQSRSNRTDGPPAWVSFGQKIAKTEEVADFKSLTDKFKDASKESAEFNAQRQDAIAEAATGAVKKVFGKGKQENVANKYNIQNDRQNSEQPRRNIRQNRRGRKDEDVEEKISAKPSDKVSLFAFLEDKLPDQPAPITNSNVNSYTANKQNRYEKTDYQVQNKNRNYDANKSKSDFAEVAPAKGFTMNTPRLNGDGSITQGARRNRFGQDYRVEPHRNPKSSNYNIENKSNNYEAKNKTENNSRRNVPSNLASKFNSETTSSVNTLTNDISRLNVNQQFASRSLQSHLNLNKGGDSKTIQSFYNKDNYGNPFGSKYNTFDKKQTANNSGGVKLQQPYQMAPIDDFGGPKLPVQTNAVQNKKCNPQDNSFGRPNPNSNQENAKSNFPSPLQNGSNIMSEYAFTGWKVGDHCMAKYWEDSRFYNATVTAITERTCVVQFNEYGNIEEVLSVDCIPISTDANFGSHNKNVAKPRNQRNRYFNRSKQ